MRIEDFFKGICARLTQRDLDGLVAQFQLPIPIYHPDGLKFVATKEQAYKTMSSILGGMDRIGVSSVDHTLVRQSERPENGAIACCAKFHYRGDKGQLLRETTVCYFFDRNGEDMKVTMVDYQVPAFKDALAA